MVLLAYTLFHSAGGGVVMVGMEQEPHRAQDWSELPIVRYGHTSCMVMFDTINSLLCTLYL